MKCFWVSIALQSHIATLNLCSSHTHLAILRALDVTGMAGLSRHMSPCLTEDSDHFPTLDQHDSLEIVIDKLSEYVRSAHPVIGDVHALTSEGRG